MQIQACLRCGKKTEGDCLIWKGGVSRVLCPDCAQEVMQEEQHERLRGKQPEKQPARQPEKQPGKQPGKQ